MAIPEVVTVSDARSHLSKLLAALADAGVDAEPVLIGPHRKPQAVLLSVAAYEALLGSQPRAAAVASATGSLGAEGLTASPEADRDAREYVHGKMSAEEMAVRAIARYTTSEQRRAW